MSIAVVVIGSLISVFGWVLCLAGISGTWLLLISGIGVDLLYDSSWDFPTTTIVAAVLCVLAEVAEFLSGLLGAKAFGGSKYAQKGAFLGTIIGAFGATFLIPIPIIGTIVGVLIGGFAGALFGEIHYRRVHDERDGVKVGVKAGVGAMVARIISIFIKVSLSTLMVGWFVWIVLVNTKAI